jgi:hypothetical protein
MTPQGKIRLAIKLLASVQEELDRKTRQTRGPNLERVAEFIEAETVAGDGDKMEAKLCWQRFAKWLPGDEWGYWNRNVLYKKLRALGYRITPATGNHLMIHGLTLKAIQ